MIKQLLSVLALSVVSVTPAIAGLTRIAPDRYSAVDSNNETHYITYIRMDHEGDVQLQVDVGQGTVYFWVNCSTDRISLGGDAYNGWDYVDHRKMEGYYSDVACGRVPQPQQSQSTDTFR